MSAIVTALTFALLASSASADQTNLRSNVVSKLSFLKDSKKFVSIQKKIKDHNKKLTESKKVKFEILATPTQWGEVHSYCDESYPEGKYIYTVPLDTCYKIIEEDATYSLKYTYDQSGDTVTVNELHYTTADCSGSVDTEESHSATSTCEYNDSLALSLWAVIVSKLALPTVAGFYENYYSSSSCSSSTSYDFYLQNVIYYIVFIIV